MDCASKERKPVGTILFTQEEIQKKAAELAAQINADYAGEELVVIGTLKGSVMWLCELVKFLTLDVRLEFMTASSYGSQTTSSGVVQIKLDTDANLYRKNILIVEDIVDTGTTLQFLIQKLEERNPKSIKVCTMLNKQSRRKNNFSADYIGFEVDDLFVVGYGLDYDQKYRNLPYVSYLSEGDL